MKGLTPANLTPAMTLAKGVLMKVGVIADTHGDVLAFEKALDIFKDTMRIIHADDILYIFYTMVLLIQFFPLIIHLS